MTPAPMHVYVIGWTRREALAAVSGVRVRVRRTRAGGLWRCDQHGRSNDPNLCEHTRALAATPADPSTYREIPGRQKRSTTA